MKHFSIILIILFIYVLCAFGSEHVLETHPVGSFNPILETIVEGEIEFRYITDGEMAGTWLEFQTSRGKIYISIVPKSEDTLKYFLNKYLEWNTKAINKSVKITKEIGDYKQSCMFINNLDKAAFSSAHLRFKFVSSSVSKHVLMIIIDKMESAINQYVTMSKTSYILDDIIVQDVLTTINSLEKLRKEADRQDNIANEFN